MQTLPYDIDADDNFDWSSEDGPLKVKAAELQRTAQTMTGGSAGPDGWSAAELASLPCAFWQQLEGRLEEWHAPCSISKSPRAWTQAHGVHPERPFGAQRWLRPGGSHAPDIRAVGGLPCCRLYLDDTGEDARLARSHHARGLSRRPAGQKLKQVSDSWTRPLPPAAQHPGQHGLFTPSAPAGDLAEAGRPRRPPHGCSAFSGPPGWPRPGGFSWEESHFPQGNGQEHLYTNDALLLPCV